VSIEFHFISGLFNAENAGYRVSSTGLQYVVTAPVSSALLNPYEGLDYLLERFEAYYGSNLTEEQLWDIMENHPRFIACVTTIEGLSEARKTNELRVEFGKTPFAPEPVSKEEDPLFYGLEIVPQPNGEVFVYVELQAKFALLREGSPPLSLSRRTTTSIRLIPSMVVLLLLVLLAQVLLMPTLLLPRPVVHPVVLLPVVVAVVMPVKHEASPVCPAPNGSPA
jgi:hypothetical protein